MHCACLFVLAGASNAAAARAAERVRRWLAPVELDLSTVWQPACEALVGAALHGPGAELRPERGLIAWGEPAPAGLATPEGLIAADGTALRALDRSIALVAYEEGRVRIAGGCSGPLALYSAHAGAIRAWSTSAVVAALLVQPDDRVRLDPASIPQLFALGFIGGRRTHLAGVEAVAPATVVDLVQREPPAALEYWPRAERWQPVPEDEAGELAERSLLSGLADRLATAPAPYLGMTAGADSRVAALALAELGLPAGTMTWGAAGNRDVDEAAGIARRLGLTHVTLSGGWHAAGSIEPELERAVRRQEGLAAPPLLGRPQWPDDLETFLTGGGGETARAFYYRLLGRLRADPSLEELADLWRPETVIARASERARQAVRDAKLEFLTEAAAGGHTGWRLLDIVYAEQRVRRWGRGILPDGPRHVIACLSGTELDRAFVSLPDADRFTDGWHRRFIERRAPDLAMPAPPAPRRGVPAPLRRLAERWRRRGAQDGLTRHAYADVFDARPEIKTWVLDEALASGSVVEAMGAEWQRWARDGFQAGAAAATEQALQVAGLASLERALARHAREAARA